MARSYVKVDSSNLKTTLLQFEEVTGKSMPQLVRAHARICAVELANRTQPFTVGSGVGPPVLARGTMYLKKDLLKITKDPETLDKKAAGIADDKLRARLQAVIAAGKNPAIAALLVAVKTIKKASDFKAVSGPKEMGPLHKSNRSSRTGHALSTQPVYHFEKGGIDGYVKTVAKRLGYAKSGWAEAARKIGGIKGDGARGIPAFAKRQKADNFDVKDGSDNQSNPSFTMTNKTPGVSRLLKNSEKDKALDGAKYKMIKQMNKILRHVAKNGKDVPAVTAELIAENATD